MGRSLRPQLTPISWAPGDWGRFTTVPITLATNTYAQAEQAYGAQGIRRGRVTRSAGAEGNDRRMLLLPEYDRDTRLVVPWQEHPLKSAGGAQVGQVQRVRVDPDGFTRAYIVRHDFTFGADYILAAELWRWPTGSTNALTIVAGAGNVGLPGLQRTVTATDAVRAGGTVTVSGLSPANGDPNGLVAGHTVSATFAGDASYNGVFVVATAVAGATTATWAQAVADDPGAGAGTINDLDGVFPLTVESRLIGSTLAVRAWRTATQSPPAWGDENRSLIFRDTGGADPYPARRGRCGLYMGHLAAGAIEWGVIDRERIR